MVTAAYDPSLHRQSATQFLVPRTMPDLVSLKLPFNAVHGPVSSIQKQLFLEQSRCSSD
jgi:hypothetical protein